MASANPIKGQGEKSNMSNAGSSVIMRYLGSPLLVMTPLFSRQWRRLVTRMSGWLSASWAITERSSLRDAASLRSKHIRVNTKDIHSQVFLLFCLSVRINEGKLNNRNTSTVSIRSNQHLNIITILLEHSILSSYLHLPISLWSETEELA